MASPPAVIFGDCIRVQLPANSSFTGKQQLRFDLDQNPKPKTLNDILLLVFST